MYYLIDNNEDQKYNESEIDELVERCVDVDYFIDNTDDFEEWFDDGNEYVRIAGYEWSASEVLKEMDYEAYSSELRCWAENMAESEADDFIYNLNHMNNADSVFVCGYQIFAYEDEQETDEDQEEINYEMIEEHVKQQLELEEAMKAEDNCSEKSFMEAMQLVCK